MDETPRQSPDRRPSTHTLWTATGLMAAVAVVVGVMLSGKPDRTPKNPQAGAAHSAPTDSRAGRADR
jgi:hypothetical protein